MPLEESFNLFIRQAKANHSLAELCYRGIRDRLAEGKNMGEALSGFASPEETLLIHSSLKGGNFADGLTLAAELLAARRKIIAAVIGALAYPAMLGSVLILFLYLISTVVMPQMTAITDPEQWNGPAALALSHLPFRQFSFRRCRADRLFSLHRSRHCDSTALDGKRQAMGR